MLCRTERRSFLEETCFPRTNEQLTILCGSIFEPGGSDLIHSRRTSQFETVKGQTTRHGTVTGQRVASPCDAPIKCPPGALWATSRFPSSGSMSCGIRSASAVPAAGTWNPHQLRHGRSRHGRAAGPTPTPPRVPRPRSTTRSPSCSSSRRCSLPNRATAAAAWPTSARVPRPLVRLHALSLPPHSAAVRWSSPAAVRPPSWPLRKI